MDRRTLLGGIGLGFAGGFGAGGITSMTIGNGKPIWTEIAEGSGTPTPTPAPPNGITGRLRKASNDRREAVYGSNAVLSLHEQLSQCAGYHARRMAEADQVAHNIDGETIGDRYVKFGLSNQVKGEAKRNRIMNGGESICRVVLEEPNVAQRALKVWTETGENSALLYNYWDKHGIGVAAKGRNLFCVQNYL